MGSLDRAVELLDRALAYTRVELSRVTEDDLGRPTPCSDWDLGQLLRHMDDGLDAFTEGAGGEVSVTPAGCALVTVESLQRKACALLGTWSAAATPEVSRVGGVHVDTAVLVLAATLEITVHGWDVGTALGRPRPVPEPLAAALLPVAGDLVSESDRLRRFGARVPVPPIAPADARLLGFLGRDPATPT